ncbi:MAG: acyltransferase family protein [Alloprevotella sp.]|nr:acyltransferase family protein [Alloprevotella sp.]
MENRKDLNWANALRAWCMVGVYLWHGEVFCGSHPFLSTYISPVCMAAFFFVSGFLFFRKYDVLTDGNFWRTEAENVFFRLAVPTMLFAALLYVPKVFFHQASPSLPDFMLAVFGGTAFWFTSALVLIQLAALLFLCATSPVRSLTLRFGALLAVSLCLWVGYMQVDAPFNAFPWSFTSAMRYFLFFALGGCCCRSRLLNGETPPRRIAVWAIPLLAAYVVLSSSIGQSQALLDHTLRLLAALAGIAALVPLALVAPSWRWQRFMGRKTIVFYFVCGLLPALVAHACRHFGLVGEAAVLPTSLLSLATAAVVAKLLSRYASALFDLRKLKR